MGWRVRCLPALFEPNSPVDAKLSASFRDKRNFVMWTCRFKQQHADPPITKLKWLALYNKLFVFPCSSEAACGTGSVFQ